NYLKKYPQYNCHILAIYRLIDEKPTTIESLARHSKKLKQILLGHWRENCLPMLVEIINEGIYL
ncbi:MAG: hypothetical protein AAFO95_12920, partial [Cyanobacteria bacterium J06600_6]